MDKDKIVMLHNSLMAKLMASIEGTEDFKEGQITNLQAPCLIRGAIADAMLILHEINKQ